MGYTLVGFATGLLRTGIADGGDLFSLVDMVLCWGEVLFELDMVPYQTGCSALLGAVAKPMRFEF